jgi:hypothetical protein
MARRARAGTSRVARAVGTRGARAAVTLLAAGMLVVGCGSAVSSPSAGPSAGVSGAATAPAASRSGSSDAANAPAPSATPWPGGVVEAVMILATGDAQIKAAGADLGNAAAYQDMKAMWGAADGLATLIERLQTQVPRIAEYPETAAAAAALSAAFPDMLAGSRALRDAITASDAAGITSGSEQLSAGLGKYAAARRLIGPLADDALLMQKHLLK